MSGRFPSLAAASVAAIVLIAIAAPVLGLPDPVRMEIAHRLATPSRLHPLGQDEFGRDVLARLVWGAQASLFVAFSAASIACIAGTLLGILGGYMRGLIEQVALRSADVLLCFPPLLLGLLVVTLMGPGTATLIPVLALVYLPGFMRVAYSGVLSVRAQDYVEAMRALGAGPMRIMTRTILPNIAGPVLVQFSLAAASGVVLESGLSFLGLGVVPPAPSWGLMIGAARATMVQAPLLLLWPCVALTLTILVMNLLCDGLRDAIDPHPLPGRRKRRPIDHVLPGLVPEQDSALETRNLTLAIGDRSDYRPAVNDVSIAVKPGETLAIVGESGSGKSLTGLSALGLLPDAVSVSSGAVLLGGKDVLHLRGEELRRLRGSKAAMIFQDPMSSLNPVHRVGEQIAEAIRAHETVSAADASRRAIELLRKVGIPAPERRARAFPHELSGGMRQRVMIAIAIANDPVLVIADEPTTALDVTIQAQVLDVLATLKRERGLALVFITHSLPVVAEIADRVVVMYAGQVVEEGEVATVFARPHHPYTAALLASAPSEDGSRPQSISGLVPSLHEKLPGCMFAPRCSRRIDRCEESIPPLVDAALGHKTRCIRWAEA
ncbi:MAG: dipeptide/oligopeptide/nickel ABC transporter permease/ATP-binding protein [Proteobacteria bacterium]|nr:dipeptide/oligopeptide/nickel ABC transporter permease/ATP-binding protein [Pseudomonadota bacterium]